VAASRAGARGGANPGKLSGTGSAGSCSLSWSSAGAAAVFWFATGGETRQAISSAMIALTFFTQLAIYPALWPQNVARSLEGSRAAVGPSE
jgi:hypothetical protein